jgi:hypothetical protein
MNCQSCRQDLEPFLDDELSVKDNVAVLEHVAACAACQEVFNSHKRMWDAVRARLVAETCPPEAAARHLAAVRTAASSAWRGGWRFWAVPIAATALALLLIRAFQPHVPPPVTPAAALVAVAPRLTFAAERTHDHSVHGELLEWAGLHYDELVSKLPGTVLTAAALQKTEPDSRSVASFEEFKKVVKAELGRDFKLPPAFLEGGRVVGGELLTWHEGRVQQVIVEFGDRDLVLYEISGCQAMKLGTELAKMMASLTPIESDPGRQVSIFACKGCDCVVVLRNNRTYLLISRNGRDWNDDWMLARARLLVQ